MAQRSRRGPERTEEVIPVQQPLRHGQPPPVQQQNLEALSADTDRQLIPVLNQGPRVAELIRQTDPESMEVLHQANELVQWADSRSGSKINGREYSNEINYIGNLARQARDTRDPAVLQRARGMVYSFALMISTQVRLDAEAAGTPEAAHLTQMIERSRQFFTNPEELHRTMGSAMASWMYIENRQVYDAAPEMKQNLFNSVESFSDPSREVRPEQMSQAFSTITSSLDSVVMRMEGTQANMQAALMSQVHMLVSLEAIRETMKGKMEKLDKAIKKMTEALSDSKKTEEEKEKEVAMVEKEIRDFVAEAIDVALADAKAPPELLAAMGKAREFLKNPKLRERGQRILMAGIAYFNSRLVLNLPENQKLKKALLDAVSKLADNQKPISAMLRRRLISIQMGISAALKSAEGRPEIVIARISESLDNLKAMAATAGNKYLSKTIDYIKKLVKGIKDPRELKIIVGLMGYIRGSLDGLSKMPAETKDEKETRDNVATLVANAVLVSLKEPRSEAAKMARLLAGVYAGFKNGALLLSISKGLNEGSIVVDEAKEKVAAFILREADASIARIKESSPELAKRIARFFGTLRKNPGSTSTGIFSRALDVLGLSKFISDKVIPHKNKKIRKGLLDIAGEALGALEKGDREGFDSSVGVAAALLDMPEQEAEAVIDGHAQKAEEAKQEKELGRYQTFMALEGFLGKFGQMELADDKLKQSISFVRRTIEKIQERIQNGEDVGQGTMKNLEKMISLVEAAAGILKERTGWDVKGQEKILGQGMAAFVLAGQLSTMSNIMKGPQKMSVEEVARTVLGEGATKDEVRILADEYKKENLDSRIRELGNLASLHIYIAQKYDESHSAEDKKRFLGMSSDIADGKMSQGKALQNLAKDYAEQLGKIKIQDPAIKSIFERIIKSLDSPTIKLLGMAQDGIELAKTIQHEENMLSMKEYEGIRETSMLMLRNALTLLQNGVESENVNSIIELARMLRENHKNPEMMELLETACSNSAIGVQLFQMVLTIRLEPGLTMEDAAKKALQSLNPGKKITSDEVTGLVKTYEGAEKARDKPGGAAVMALELLKRSSLFIEIANKKKAVEVMQSRAIGLVEKSLYQPLIDALGRYLINISQGEKPKDEDILLIQRSPQILAGNGGTVSRLFVTSQDPAIRMQQAEVFAGLRSIDQVLKPLRGLIRERTAAIYAKAQEELEKGNLNETAVYLSLAQAYASTRTPKERKEIQDYVSRLSKSTMSENEMLALPKDERPITSAEALWISKVYRERFDISTGIRNPAQKRNFIIYSDLALKAYQQGDQDGANLLRNAARFYGNAALGGVRDGIALADGTDGIPSLKQLQEGISKGQSLAQILGAKKGEEEIVLQTFGFRLREIDIIVGSAAFDSRMQNVESRGVQYKAEAGRLGRLRTTAQQKNDSIGAERLEYQIGLVDIEKTKGWLEQAKTTRDDGVRLLRFSLAKEREALQKSGDDAAALMKEAGELRTKGERLLYLAENIQASALLFHTSISEVGTIHRQRGRHECAMAADGFVAVAKELRDTEGIPEEDVLAKHQITIKSANQSLQMGASQISQQRGIQSSVWGLVQRAKKLTADNQKFGEVYGKETKPIKGYPNVRSSALAYDESKIQKRIDRGTQLAMSERIGAAGGVLNAAGFHMNSSVLAAVICSKHWNLIRQATEREKEEGMFEFHTEAWLGFIEKGQEFADQGNMAAAEDQMRFVNYEVVKIQGWRQNLHNSFNANVTLWRMGRADARAHARSLADRHYDITTDREVSGIDEAPSGPQSVRALYRTMRSKNRKRYVDAVEKAWTDWEQKYIDKGTFPTAEEEAAFRTSVEQLPEVKKAVQRNEEVEGKFWEGNLWSSDLEQVDPHYQYMDHALMGSAPNRKKQDWHRYYSEVEASNRAHSTWQGNAQDANGQADQAMMRAAQLQWIKQKTFSTDDVPEGNPKLNQMLAMAVAANDGIVIETLKAIERGEDSLFGIGKITPEMRRAAFKYDSDSELATLAFDALKLRQQVHGASEKSRESLIAQAEDKEMQIMQRLRTDPKKMDIIASHLLLRGVRTNILTIGAPIDKINETLGRSLVYMAKHQDGVLQFQQHESGRRIATDAVNMYIQAHGARYNLQRARPHGFESRVARRQLELSASGFLGIARNASSDTAYAHHQAAQGEMIGQWENAYKMYGEALAGLATPGGVKPDAITEDMGYAFQLMREFPSVAEVTKLNVRLMHASWGIYIDPETGETSELHLTANEQRVLVAAMQSANGALEQMLGTASSLRTFMSTGAGDEGHEILLELESHIEEVEKQIGTLMQHAAARDPEYIKKYGITDEMSHSELTKITGDITSHRDKTFIKVDSLIQSGTSWDTAVMIGETLVKTVAYSALAFSGYGTAAGVAGLAETYVGMEEMVASKGGLDQMETRELWAYYGGYAVAGAGAIVGGLSDSMRMARSLSSPTLGTVGLRIPGTSSLAPRALDRVTSVLGSGVMDKITNVGGLLLMGGGVALGGLEVYNMYREGVTSEAQYGLAFWNALNPALAIGGSKIMSLNPKLAHSRSLGATMYRGMMGGLFGISQREMVAAHKMQSQQQYNAMRESRVARIRGPTRKSTRKAQSHQWAIDETAFTAIEQRQGSLTTEERIMVLEHYNAGEGGPRQINAVEAAGLLSDYNSLVESRIGQLSPEAQTRIRQIPDLIGRQLENGEALAIINEFGHEIPGTLKAEMVDGKPVAKVQVDVGRIMQFLDGQRMNAAETGKKPFYTLTDYASYKQRQSAKVLAGLEPPSAAPKPVDTGRVLAGLDTAAKSRDYQKTREAILGITIAGYSDEHIAFARSIASAADFFANYNEFPPGTPAEVVKAAQALAGAKGKKSNFRDATNYGNAKQQLQLALDATSEIFIKQAEQTQSAVTLGLGTAEGVAKFTRRIVRMDSDALGALAQLPQDIQQTVRDLANDPRFFVAAKSTEKEETIAKFSGPGGKLRDVAQEAAEKIAPKLPPPEAIDIPIQKAVGDGLTPIVGEEVVVQPTGADQTKAMKISIAGGGGGRAHIPVPESVPVTAESGSQPRAIPLRLVKQKSETPAVPVPAPEQMPALPPRKRLTELASLAHDAVFGTDAQKLNAADQIESLDAGEQRAYTKFESLAKRMKERGDDFNPENYSTAYWEQNAEPGVIEAQLKADKKIADSLVDAYNKINEMGSKPIEHGGLRLAREYRRMLKYIADGDSPQQAAEKVVMEYRNHETPFSWEKRTPASAAPVIATETVPLATYEGAIGNRIGRPELEKVIANADARTQRIARVLDYFRKALGESSVPPELRPAHRATKDSDSPAIILEQALRFTQDLPAVVESPTEQVSIDLGPYRGIAMTPGSEALEGVLSGYADPRIREVARVLEHIKDGILTEGKVPGNMPKELIAEYQAMRKSASSEEKFVIGPRDLVGQAINYVMRKRGQAEEGEPIPLVRRKVQQAPAQQAQEAPVIPPLPPIPKMPEVSQSVEIPVAEQMNFGVFDFVASNPGSAALEGTLSTITDKNVIGFARVLERLNSMDADYHQVPGLPGDLLNAYRKFVADKWNEGVYFLKPEHFVGFAKEYVAKKQTAALQESQAIPLVKIKPPESEDEITAVIPSEDLRTTRKMKRPEEVIEVDLGEVQVVGQEEPLSPPHPAQGEEPTVITSIPEEETVPFNPAVAADSTLANGEPKLLNEPTYINGILTIEASGLGGDIGHAVKPEHAQFAVNGEFKTAGHSVKPKGLWLSWGSGWDNFTKFAGIDFLGNVKFKAEIRSGLKLFLLRDGEAFSKMMTEFRKDIKVAKRTEGSYPEGTWYDGKSSYYEKSPWQWLKEKGYDGVAVTADGVGDTNYQFMWDAESIVIFEPKGSVNLPNGEARLKEYQQSTQSKIDSFIPEIKKEVGGLHTQKEAYELLDAYAKGTEVLDQDHKKFLKKLKDDGLSLEDAAESIIKYLIDEEAEDNSVASMPAPHPAQGEEPTVITSIPEEITRQVPLPGGEEGVVEPSGPTHLYQAQSTSPVSEAQPPISSDILFQRIGQSLENSDLRQRDASSINAQHESTPLSEDALDNALFLFKDRTTDGSSRKIDDAIEDGLIIAPHLPDTKHLDIFAYFNPETKKIVSVVESHPDNMPASLRNNSDLLIVKFKVNIESGKIVAITQTPNANATVRIANERPTQDLALTGLVGMRVMKQKTVQAPEQVFSYVHQPLSSQALQDKLVAAESKGIITPEQAKYLRNQRIFLADEAKRDQAHRQRVLDGGGILKPKDYDSIPFTDKAADNAVTLLSHSSDVDGQQRRTIDLALESSGWVPGEAGTINAYFDPRTESIVAVVIDPTNINSDTDAPFGIPREIARDTILSKVEFGIGPDGRIINVRETPNIPGGSAFADPEGAIFYSLSALKGMQIVDTEPAGGPPSGPRKPSEPRDLKGTAPAAPRVTPTDMKATAPAAPRVSAQEAAAPIAKGILSGNQDAIASYNSMPKAQQDQIGFEMTKQLGLDTNIGLTRFAREVRLRNKNILERMSMLPQEVQDAVNRLAKGDLSKSFASRERKTQKAAVETARGDMLDAIEGTMPEAAQEQVPIAVGGEVFETMKPPQEHEVHEEKGPVIKAVKDSGDGSKGPRIVSPWAAGGPRITVGGPSATAHVMPPGGGAVAPKQLPRGERQRQRFLSKPFRQSKLVRTLTREWTLSKGKKLSKEFNMEIAYLMTQPEDVQQRVREKTTAKIRETSGDKIADSFDEMFTILMNVKGTQFSPEYKPVLELAPTLYQDPGGSKTSYPGKEDVMKRGTEELLHAQGIEVGKGGFENLLNIMIEGEIRYGQFGGLSEEGGLQSMLAGGHGPYYIVVDRSVAKTPAPENFHIAYIVPTNEHKKGVIAALNQAVEQGLMSHDEAVGVMSKVATYDEFANAPKGIFEKPGDFAASQKAQAEAVIAGAPTQKPPSRIPFSVSDAEVAVELASLHQRAASPWAGETFRKEISAEAMKKGISYDQALVERARGNAVRKKASRRARESGLDNVVKIEATPEGEVVRFARSDGTEAVMSRMRFETVRALVLEAENVINGAPILDESKRARLTSLKEDTEFNNAMQHGDRTAQFDKALRQIELPGRSAELHDIAQLFISGEPAKIKDATARFYALSNSEKDSINAMVSEGSRYVNAGSDERRTIAREYALESAHRAAGRPREVPNKEKLTELAQAAWHMLYGNKDAVGKFLDGQDLSMAEEHAYGRFYQLMKNQAMESPEKINIQGYVDGYLAEQAGAATHDVTTGYTNYLKAKAIQGEIAIQDFSDEVQLMAKRIDASELPAAGPERESYLNGKAEQVRIDLANMKALIQNYDQTPENRPKTPAMEMMDGYVSQGMSLGDSAEHVLLDMARIDFLISTYEQGPEARPKTPIMGFMDSQVQAGKNVNDAARLTLAGIKAAEAAQSATYAADEPHVPMPAAAFDSKLNTANLHPEAQEMILARQSQKRLSEGGLDNCIAIFSSDLTAAVQDGLSYVNAPRPRLPKEEGSNIPVSAYVNSEGIIVAVIDSWSAIRDGTSSIPAEVRNNRNLSIAILSINMESGKIENVFWQAGYETNLSTKTKSQQHPLTDLVGLKVLKPHEPSSPGGGEGGHSQGPEGPESITHVSGDGETPPIHIEADPQENAPTSQYGTEPQQVDPTLESEVMTTPLKVAEKPKPQAVVEEPEVGKTLPGIGPEIGEDIGSASTEAGIAAQGVLLEEQDTQDHYEPTVASPGVEKSSGKKPQTAETLLSVAESFSRLREMEPQQRATELSKLDIDKNAIRAIVGILEYPQGDPIAVAIANEWEISQVATLRQRRIDGSRELGALKAIDEAFGNSDLWTGEEGSGNPTVETLIAALGLSKNTPMSRTLSNPTESNSQRNAIVAAYNSEGANGVMKYLAERGFDSREVQRLLVLDSHIRSNISELPQRIREAYEYEGVLGVFGELVGLGTLGDKKILTDTANLAQGNMTFVELVIKGDLAGKIQTLPGYENARIYGISKIPGGVGRYRIILSNGRELFAQVEDYAPARLGAQLFEAQGLWKTSDRFHKFSYETGILDPSQQPEVVMFGFTQDMHDFAKDSEQIRIRMPESGQMEDVKVAGVALKNDLLMADINDPVVVQGLVQRGSLEAVKTFRKMLGTSKGREEIMKAWAAYHEMARRAIGVDRFLRNTAMVLVKRENPKPGQSEYAITFQPFDTDFVGGRILGKRDLLNFHSFDKDFADASIKFVKELHFAAMKGNILISQKKLALELLRAHESCSIPILPETAVHNEAVLQGHVGKAFGFPVREGIAVVPNYAGRRRVVMREDGRMILNRPEELQKIQDTTLSANNRRDHDKVRRMYFVKDSGFALTRSDIQSLGPLK